ncbi:MAG: TonB-dependent receptor [Rhodocyclaceae bacterium]|nr:MAG: TonB-dependent receptor [Rhodocyclaceae bacterium]
MASYGNQDSLRLRTTVNLPAMGPLSMKFSYLHDESHGWMKNIIGGQKMDYSVRIPSFGTLTYADRLGARNVDAFQLAAHLDLGSVTADYRFDYTDSKTVGSPVQVLGHTGSLAGATGFIFALQPLYGGTTNLVTDKPLKRVANSTTAQPLKVQGHNLTLAWEASDNFTVKNITGFRKFKQKPNAFDLAGTGGLLFTENQLLALLGGNIPGVTNPANAPGPNDHIYTLMTARSTSQKQFTQELQGLYTSSVFDLTFGAFYFRERSPALNVLGILQPTVNGAINTTPVDAMLGSGINENIATNKSYAAYAQGTFHVTDKFDIALGGRFTKDKRKMELIHTGSAGVGSGGILPPGTYRKTFNEFTYTAIATYRPTSDITGYAKISTGYVAGGILSAIPYDPEKLTSYELGLKTELFDRRLRANLAAYLMDYKDMQIQTFQDGVQRFENAGKARIWGWEAEFTAVPTDGLTLEANIGYTNFKYKEYLSAAAGGGVIDVSDLAQPTYSPKWNMRLSGQYNFPEFSSGGHAMARLDARYRSTVALGTFPPDGADLAARAVSKAHWIVDGRIGLVDMPVFGSKVGVSLWGQNLFDKDDIGLFGPTAIVQTIQYINGRTYGLEVNFAF